VEQISSYLLSDESLIYVICTQYYSTLFWICFIRIFFSFLLSEDDRCAPSIYHVSGLCVLRSHTNNLLARHLQTLSARSRNETVCTNSVKTIMTTTSLKGFGEKQRSINSQKTSSLALSVFILQY